MKTVDLKPGFKNYRLIRSFYDPHLYSPEHADGCTRISVILQGNVLEIAGGKEESASVASIVIKPPDLRHINYFGPKGAKILSVLIRDPMGNDAICQFVKQWVWVHGAHSLPFTGQLLLGLLDSRCEEDFERCLVRFLMSLEQIRNADCKEAPSWLADVKIRIDNEYANYLQTRQLADRAGVHPVYLARAFRKYYHCTVREYITRLRLVHTVREIGASEISLSQIAFKNGFADQSHLHRHFKKVVGVTPGHFSRLLNQ